MDWDLKSDEFFRSSAKLIKESFFTSSVHCSYYSCVNLLFYVLSQFSGKNIKEIEYESNAKINKVGTHVWLVKEALLIYQSQCTDRKAYRDLKDKITSLKTIRTQADYYNSFECDQKLANKCRDEAYQIRKEIRSVLFNI